MWTNSFILNSRAALAFIVAWGTVLLLGIFVSYEGMCAGADAAYCFIPTIGPSSDDSSDVLAALVDLRRGQGAMVPLSLFSLFFAIWTFMSWRLFGTDLTEASNNLVVAAIAWGVMLIYLLIVFIVFLRPLWDVEQSVIFWFLMTPLLSLLVGVAYWQYAQILARKVRALRSEIDALNGRILGVAEEIVLIEEELPSTTAGNTIPDVLELRSSIDNSLAEANRIPMPRFDTENWRGNSFSNFEVEASDQFVAHLHRLHFSLRVSERLQRGSLVSLSVLPGVLDVCNRQKLAIQSSLAEITTDVLANIGRSVQGFESSLDDLEKYVGKSDSSSAIEVRREMRSLAGRSANRLMDQADVWT